MLCISHPPKAPNNLDAGTYENKRDDLSFPGNPMFRGANSDSPGGKKKELFINY